MVASGIEAFARPASVTLAIWCDASWAKRRALACCRELGRWLAEANCSEAIASLVVFCPACWAFLSRSVHWFLTILAKAQLCEAFASVVTCGIQALPWPAALVAFTRGICAVRTDLLTSTRLRKLAWRLAETNGGEAIACLVLGWPARWTFLTWSVHRLFAIFAEAELCEAFACFVWSVIEAASWPTCIITLARRVFALRAQFLALAVRR
jgi:hypothetical protein